MSLSVDIEKKLGAFHLRSQFKAPDETMALLGASGCGKSMTLKCIAGIVTPDRGRIVLGGRVLFDSEKKINLPPQQRRVGYLFQQYGLFPNMSVEQNILCGIRGGDKAEKRHVLAEKIRMFRLEGLEKKHPAQLSGGQQQRVALARVLVLRPKILLMDEPLSNLDAKLRLHMRTEIRRIQQDLRITCLYVTHDQKEALTMSDRIMVMNRGRIEQVGTPMELYEDPATPFVADFIGQANLIPGTLLNAEDGYARFQIGEAVLKARMGRQNPPAKGEKALLVVRPENLGFSQDGGGIAMRIVNRLFEGDRINYEVVIPGLEQMKPFAMSVPFLPGTKLADADAAIYASFMPDAGVVIRG